MDHTDDNTNPEVVLLNDSTAALGPGPAPIAAAAAAPGLHPLPAQAAAPPLAQPPIPIIALGPVLALGGIPREHAESPLMGSLIGLRGLH